jgi:hypothetical protein
MFASNYGSKSVFASNLKTINLVTGFGIGYSGAGAYYGGGTQSGGPSSSGPSSGGPSSGGGSGSLPLIVSYYGDLARIVANINPIIYNYSIGNFEYVIEYFTSLVYYDLTMELFKLKQDENIFPEYEVLRQSITRTLEGLNKAVQIYNDFQSNKLQLISTRNRASILDNMSELKKYIESLVGSISLFPDVAITSIAATLKPEIAIYIKLYGFPDGGIFDTDKLAFAIKLSQSTQPT